MALYDRSAEPADDAASPRKMPKSAHERVMRPAGLVDSPFGKFDDALDAIFRGAAEAESAEAEHAELERSRGASPVRRHRGFHLRKRSIRD